ncbi:MAG: asparagine synthase (glutamine-hydrolyzing) [Oscillospiraceae bacterium]|nr:asparagine synthase (glutamine-hydrolyzing) [Oscillospiraceae bacterium]
MCGFVGFTNCLGIDKGTDVINEMMDTIVHRGPDSSGDFVDEDICLGFRRLSIIDLNDGSQPIYNEDKSKVLIFNGEIYNYQELRADLVKKGHVFYTKTDSEVLIHGYEEYGVELTDKLRGMFAFVIWDKNEKTLFGARDPFGIKPFYYLFMADSLIFGSEMKAFTHYPEFVKELNPKALEQYLSFQYSALDETFFKNVYKLTPGHYFVYKDGKMDIKRYFTANFDPKDGTLDEYAAKIDECIRESVEAHKISDVEVGSFLSSGIDSSYIVATANVDKTFTVGFADNGYSEIDYAKEFSESIGIKNISKIITSEEYFDEFSKVQYYMDEPLADPAAVALYFVCKLAAQSVKVILSGEGADELFGGYRVYSEPLSGGAYNKLPFFIKRVVSKIAVLFPHTRGFNFLIRQGQYVEEKHIGNAKMFSKKEREKLLKNPLHEPSPQEICRPIYDSVAGKDDITKMQIIDINTWLIGDILLKADRMSMANSLEVRVPYLDRRVMELAAQIPWKLRVSPTNTKMALRKAASESLPEFTAQKPKLGFPVPIRVWLKQDKYYNMVRDTFNSKAGKLFFNTDQLLKLLDDHKNCKKDNSRKIWTVYTFLIWYKQYFPENA